MSWKVGAAARHDQVLDVAVVISDDRGNPGKGARARSKPSRWILAANSWLFRWIDVPPAHRASAPAHSRTPPRAAAWIGIHGHPLARRNNADDAVSGDRRFFIGESAPASIYRDHARVRACLLAIVVGMKGLGLLAGDTELQCGHFRQTEPSFIRRWGGAGFDLLCFRVNGRQNRSVRPIHPGRRP